MKKILVLAIALAFLLPVRAMAVSDSAGASLSATVSSTSGVSDSVSTVTINPTTTFADGISAIIVEVYGKKADSTAVSGKTASCATNRGALDTVFAYDSGVIGSDSSTITDTNGYAKFIVRSVTPGNAVIVCTVDSTELASKPSAIFVSTASISRVSLSINLPKSITRLFSPGENVQIIKPTTGTTGNIEQNAINYSVPWWVVLLIILIILSEPFLIYLVLRLSQRTKRSFSKEEKYLNQERGMLEKIFELEEKIAEKSK